MPFYGDRFYSSPKVVGMTNAEREAYKALLWFAWKDAQCSLPDDMAELKALAHWDEKDRATWQKVRRCFEPHPNVPDRLSNTVLYAEWQKARRIRALRKQAAFKRHQTAQPEPVRARRLTTGFESVGTIADQHFPPK